MTLARPAESRIYLLLRFGMGALFILDSWDKIRYPAAFAQVIQNYALLPAGMIPPVAILLPWVEALCGVSLIVGRLCLGGLAILNGLMLIFITALAINVIRGVDVACGCFSSSGSEQRGTYAWYFVRDIAILAVGLWLLIYEIRKDMTDDQFFAS